MRRLGISWPAASAGVSAWAMASKESTTTRGWADQEAVAAVVRAAGWQPQFYLADGAGGADLDRAAQQRELDGVLELCLAELIAGRAGQPGSAGPDRLTGAALGRIPQVITPGDLPVGIPGPIVDALAKEVAEKACAAQGPTCLWLPSPPTDARAESYRIFEESLRNWVYGVPIFTSPWPADQASWLQEPLAWLQANLPAGQSVPGRFHFPL